MEGEGRERKVFRWEMAGRGVKTDDGVACVELVLIGGGRRKEGGNVWNERRRRGKCMVNGETEAVKNEVVNWMEIVLMGGREERE